MTADRLVSARSAVLADIEALSREFDQVVAASTSSNADDEEKDPSPPTPRTLGVGPCRRADGAGWPTSTRPWPGGGSGTYGVCEGCGRPIAAERLVARPAARSCIDCAR